MGYDNEYNRAIAKQLRNIDQRHIDRINNISETNQYDIATPLEAMTMRNHEVVGGSGFAAATVQDLGYDPTIGVTPNTGGGISGGGISGGGISGGGISGGGMSGGMTWKYGGGMSGGGMSGGGVSGGGMSGGSATDRPIGGGMSGGALLTLTDMYSMQGQPPATMQKKVTIKASPHKDQPTPEPARGSMINGPVGAGKPKARSRRAVSADAPRTSRAPNERNQLVRKIMQEQKMSLPQASKYVKEKGLYTRK